MNFPTPYRGTVAYEKAKGGGIHVGKFKIPPQNIVNKLFIREIWTGRKCGREKYLQRSMYQSIFPNFTVTKVATPSGFLRKFTPDGKYLLAFSSDRMWIQLYMFKGPQAANHLFTQKNEKSNGDTNWTFQNCDHISLEEDDERIKNIRSCFFDSFFQLKFRINLTSGAFKLNHECSLFTDDSRYLIVASAQSIIREEEDPPPVPPKVHEVYRNNESLTSAIISDLEDYKIHLVDITNGCQLDSLTFKVDKIYLSDNKGLYLYNNKMLSILSIQHQTIHIYYIVDGRFVKTHTLGRSCYDDDELVLNEKRLYGNILQFREAFMNSLKHRLLVYLYKEAIKFNGVERVGFSFQVFRKHYDTFENLKIWKMQIIDDDNLLLKYARENIVTRGVDEPADCCRLIVFYNIKNTEIVALFSNPSKRFLYMFEHLYDSFRNDLAGIDASYASSHSNNQCYRQLFKSFVARTKDAGKRRIFSLLPISAQSCSPWPYVDLGLFSYNDNRISTTEEPKNCEFVPISFSSRDSELHKFKMYAGIISSTTSLLEPTGTVSFIMHPRDTFAISIQQLGEGHLVNFHLRLDDNQFYCT